MKYRRSEEGWVGVALRAHVSTKFQTQINSVAEKLKKRNDRGGAFYIGATNRGADLHQKFHKNVQRWSM